LNRISFQRSSPFYDELRNEVNKYFEQTGQSSTGDIRLYLKTAILILLTAGLYAAMLLLEPGWPGILLSALFGFVLALIGFNIMHDACHGSYSRSKWINEFFGYSMNFLGSNQFIWKIKHNRIHHTFTNVDGIDDDIIKVPVLRHCKSQPYKKIHRYQHIYGFFLYAISTILWVSLTDSQKYFGKNISGTPITDFPLREHVIFWLSKLFYVFFYIALPIWVLGFMPWLVGYLIMNAVFGITLSIVFQLAHAVEITHFEDANNKNVKVEKEWAAHQVETTADFAMDNRIINWLVGGLNFQVVHHLFPLVSHVHYPAIQPIVRRVSEKHGIVYRSFPGIGSAIASHVNYLKQLGQGE
jgi:linoleoyl-CoA desaturase